MEHPSKKIVCLFITTFMILVLSGEANATIPISSCTTISTSGEYVLTQDIVNYTTYSCIDIVSSNVVLDGGGYTIDSYVTRDGSYGVHVYSISKIANVTVKNVKVKIWTYGIYLDSSSDSTLTDNTASQTWEGIYLNYSSNNVISGNTVSNNGDGIYLSQSNNNIINVNTANSNNDGIYLFSSNNNTLNGNTASSNRGLTGIILQSSSNNNTLINNTANSNRYRGIGLYISNDNKVTSNTVNSNGESGLYLYSSSNNNLSANTINSNALSGIRIYQSSSDNNIYNNFFNNTNNFVFDSYADMLGNYWNTPKTSGTNIAGGPYLGGNFWAHPNGTGFSQMCTDGDSDGICDSAYPLSYANRDNLPLAVYTAQAPTNSIGYSAIVATGQNTFVQSSNGTFGLLLKGQTKTINDSVLLNNTGDISARVEARFNDSIGGVFGLISGANILNASNFALGLPSSLVPLSSFGADVQVAVAPPGVTALDARLGVPNEQAAGDYSGTVILTFSNNV